MRDDDDDGVPESPIRNPTLDEVRAFVVSLEDKPGLVSRALGSESVSQGDNTQRGMVRKALQYLRTSTKPRSEMGSAMQEFVEFWTRFMDARDPGATDEDSAVTVAPVNTTADANLRGGPARGNGHRNELPRQAKLPGTSRSDFDELDGDDERVGEHMIAKGSDVTGTDAVVPTPPDVRAGTKKAAAAAPTTNMRFSSISETPATAATVMGEPGRSAADTGIQTMDPRELVIDERLKALVPRPRPAVLDAMRESIRQQGVQAAVDVRAADKMLFDGFTRCQLAIEAGVPVPVRFHPIPIDEELGLRTIRAAVERRQLFPFDLVRVGQALYQIERKKARDRMKSGRRPTDPPNMCAEGKGAGEAIDIVAGAVGLGRRILREGFAVLVSGREDLIDLLDRDEIKIHQAFVQLQTSRATGSAPNEATTAHRANEDPNLKSAGAAATRPTKAKRSKRAKPSGPKTASDGRGQGAESAGDGAAADTLDTANQYPTEAAGWAKHLVEQLGSFINAGGVEAIQAGLRDGPEIMREPSPRDLLLMLEGIAADLRKIGIE